MSEIFAKYVTVHKFSHRNFYSIVIEGPISKDRLCPLPVFNNHRRTSIQRISLSIISLGTPGHHQCSISISRTKKSCIRTLGASARCQVLLWNNLEQLNSGTTWSHIPLYPNFYFIAGLSAYALTNFYILIASFYWLIVKLKENDQTWGHWAGLTVSLTWVPLTTHCPGYFWEIFLVSTNLRTTLMLYNAATIMNPNRTNFFQHKNCSSFRTQTCTVKI